MIMIMRTPYSTRPIPRPQHTRRQPLKTLSILAVLFILVGAYAAYALLRPLPQPSTVILPPVLPAKVQVGIPWPAGDEAAFGASGYGLLATHNGETPHPTASTAKVITALAILQKKPLKPGEQGPAITITANDVQLYSSYVAEDGSVVPVTAGETISERQALEAMMLPSANNIADTTAIWAFGSLQAYIDYAQNMVRGFGMTHTTVTSASGFAPTTMSTASDLVLLGTKALENPVLSGIVDESEADFPDYGTITNVNTLLGRAGIRGIKTGNTDQAGGVYLGAADITVAGKTITVITAVMAAPSLEQAMRDSLPLIQSAVSQFSPVTIVRSGDTVGHATTAWGTSTPITADKTISVVAWSGNALSPTNSVRNITVPAPAHTPAGTMRMQYAGQQYSTGLYTTASLSAPSAMWRLSHPF